MELSSKNLQYTGISGRILELANFYKDHKKISNKELLDMCGVNKSLISSIKSGHIKNPNSEIIQRIVKKTGCSGNWLLIGEGEMFEPQRNPDDPETDATLIEYAFTLLNRIEQRADALKEVQPPQDIDLLLARLLVKVLERKRTVQ